MLFARMLTLTRRWHHCGWSAALTIVWGLAAVWVMKSLVVEQ